MASELQKRIGLTLKIYRAAKDLTQMDIALALGTSQKNISFLENELEVPAYILMKAAAFLDIDISEEEQNADSEKRGSDNQRGEG